MMNNNHLLQQPPSANSSAPNSNGPASGGAEQSSQDLRSLAIQQQLIAAMQQNQMSASLLNQQQHSVAGAIPGQSASNNSASNLNTLYQQLIAQQLQQQAVSQHQPAASAAGLPQQFNTSLHLQNSSSSAGHQANSHHQNQGGMASAVSPTAAIPSCSANQQQPAGGAVASALTHLLATNPNLLHSAIAGGGQIAPSGGSNNNPLAAVLAQLLTPQNLAMQQQQQQQQQLLNLVQLLQNPNTATLYAYHNYLQQQQSAQTSPQQAQLNLLSQLLGGAGGMPTSQMGHLSSGSLLSHSQSNPQIGSSVQTEESKALLEQILQRHAREQQQQQQAALLAASSASHAHTPTRVFNPPSHSGNEQENHTPVPSNEFHRIQEQASTSQAFETSTGLPPTSRQASSDRLLTSAESVQDHISRLISENEAIVEPNPVLLKKRPYHRQSTSNSITSQTSEMGLRDSPGLQQVQQQLRNPTTRSHSLHEASMLGSMRLAGGSLSSGQPIIRHPYSNSMNCSYCELKFPNQAGLEAHESRCQKNEPQLKKGIEKQHSQPQFKTLPNSTTQSQSTSHEQLLLQIQQQKLLAQQQQHQSNIAALVGGGMGVAPDVIINGAGNCGRSSVPVGAGSNSRSGQDNNNPLGELLPIAHQQHILSASSSSSKSNCDSPTPAAENRHPLKKRLLDAVARETESCSSAIIDVVLDENAESSTKVAKMDPSTSSLQLLQQVILQQQQLQLDDQRNAFASKINLEELKKLPPELQNIALLQQVVTAQQQQHYLASQQQQESQRSNNPPNNFEEAVASSSTVNNATISGTHQNNEVQQRGCPKNMRDAIFIAISSVDSKNSSRMPYLLTLSENMADELRGENSASRSTPYRNRMRNITSDTFVCLNKPKPMITEQRNGTISMYSNSWPQAAVNPEEERMISLFLGSASSTRISRMGFKECCLYTAACKDSNGLRTTHSSFWALLHNRNLHAHSPGEVMQPIIEEDVLPVLAAIASSNNLQDHIGESACVGHHLDNPKYEVHYCQPSANFDNHTQQEQCMDLDELKLANKDGNFVRFREEISVEPEKKEKPPPATPLKRIPSNSGNKVQKSARLPPTMDAYMLSNSSRKSIRRTEEVDVYVRGRGRGRYVCDRCGIRCKKPSMLKKHLKSHTNIRPYTCISCSFSFKTKGNLTKHLFSKAHRRRLADNKGGLPTIESAEYHFMGSTNSEDEDDEEGRLIVVDEEDEEGNNVEEQGQLMTDQEFFDDPSIIKLSVMESRFVNDEYDLKNDDDEYESCSENGDDVDEILFRDSLPPCSNAITYKRFGQENILVERSTHTPPTLWMLYDQEEEKLPNHWPKAEVDRCCHSAPPVALCSPDSSRRTRKLSTVKALASSSHNLTCIVDKEMVETGQPSINPYLLSDISPPASVDCTSNTQQLIANFIPVAKPIVQQSHVFSSNMLQGGNLQSLTSGSIDLNFLHNTQPQLAALINAAVARNGFNPAQDFIAGNKNGFALPGGLVSGEVDADHKLGSAFSAPVLCSASTSNSLDDQHTFVHPGQPGKPNINSMEAFLANESQEFPCDMCDRKFRKESDLHLHTQTHLIEQQQNARSRTFQCPECKTHLKSKVLLGKHMENVHNRHPTEEGAADAKLIGSIGSSQPMDCSPGTASGTNNFRNFVCVDCNLGFRTHGVLAKHLRSKNHVKTLVTLGKLPEDALNLILKENGHVLGNIDIADCEAARTSLLNILTKLRSNHQQTPSFSGANQIVNLCNTSSSSLECREQLTNVSPGPSGAHNGFNIKIGINEAAQRQSSIAPRSTAFAYQKPSTPLAHGQKRKNERGPSQERDSPVARKRCASNSRIIGIETKFHGPTPGVDEPQSSWQHQQSAHPNSCTTSTKIGGSCQKSEEFVSTSSHSGEYSAPSPLHSLANVVVAAAAAANGSTPTNKTPIVANVWIPPRVEHHVVENHEKRMGTPESSGNNVMMNNMTKLLLDAAAMSDNVLSNRSAEDTSESTGRSESSTPVQRSQTNGIGVSPMPAATRCQLCEITFDTPADLQVHFHADHVLMRDGKDFKCPRKNCDKLYPNKESLRAHIIAHFFGGGATPTIESRDEGAIAASPLSSEVLELENSSQRKMAAVPHVQTAPSAPNQSPGIPEETAVGRLHSSPTYSPRKTGKQQDFSGSSTAEERLKNSGSAAPCTPLYLPCNICSMVFNDALQLQTHWMQSHWSQAMSGMQTCSRPFVCQECDAGFTTQEALNCHNLTHSSKP